jgi:hypothetical protein
MKVAATITATVLGMVGLCTGGAGMAYASPVRASATSDARAGAVARIPATYMVPRACPSVAEVSKALGLSLSKPTTVRHTGYIKCTYVPRTKGLFGIGSILKPTVEWYVDSPAAFAVAEKNAVADLGAVAVHGIGTAAYGVTYGLFVLKGDVLCSVQAQVSNANIEKLMLEVL